MHWSCTWLIHLFLFCMLGRSVIEASSFSSFGKRSSLTKSATSMNLAELDEVFPEQPPGYDDSFLEGDDNAFAFDFSQKSPISVAEAAMDDLETFPSGKISVGWIKDVLVPLLRCNARIGRNFFEELLSQVSRCFELDDTIHSISLDEAQSLIVVGDIHGAFDAMVESIFESCGYPADDLFYIFNGDLIDRGPKSLECLILAFALKVAEPTRFFVTRGNHESMTVSPGSFFTECAGKLAHILSAFDDCHRVFRMMPVGYLVNHAYFIAHGGLCPGLDLPSLMFANRFAAGFENLPTTMALMWNDPFESSFDQVVPVDFDESNAAIESLFSDSVLNASGMGPNRRGPGCESFSSRVTHEFLRRHGLELFIRSHQYAPEGFRYSHQGKCLTIFSSPDYLGHSSDGAVVRLRQGESPLIMPMARKDLHVNQTKFGI